MTDTINALLTDEGGTISNNIKEGGPGGLTYVRPRYRGWQDKMTDDVAYPLFQRGPAGNPPSSTPGGGGGREHGCSRPQFHSFGKARCPIHPPRGVGIRLVRGGVWRVSRRSGTGGRHQLASDFALSFFALAIPVSGGIQEWPTSAIPGCPRVCP